MMPNALVNGELISITDEEALWDGRVVLEIEAQAMRDRRDLLIKETDWWAVADRTMTQAETDYRQALRDVPAQEGFPENITWPTKPE